MKLIKNKRAWRKWAKDEGVLNQDGPAAEPKTYPCYAYTSCRSFGYEELNEHYLYEVDLGSMLFKLQAAWDQLYRKKKTP